MRIGGMATGMDMDATIKDMMKPYRLRVDKQKQQRDLVKWKQDLYRSINKSMRDLNDKYFDVLSKDYLLSETKLSSTVATSKDSSIVDVKGLAGAKSGTYSIKVDKLAKTANVKSKIELSDGIKTKLDLNSNSELTFNINGIAKKITIKKDSTAEDLINTINSELKDDGVKASYSEFSKVITVENSKTGSNSSLEINGMENIRVNGKALFETKVTKSNYGELDLLKAINIDENMSLKSVQGMRFKVPAEYSNDDAEFKIDIKDTDTAKDIIEQIKSKVKEPDKVELNDGDITIDGKSVFDLKVAINDTFELKEISGENLTIGDNVITIDGADTIKSLADKIKAQTNEDVSIIGGKIRFKTGSENKISFTNKDVLKTYSYDQVKGSDAEFSIILPDGTKCEGVTSETNGFIKDNMTFTFNSMGETTFTIKNDATNSVNAITDFVTEYNKMVDDIYKQVSTKKNKYGEYLPLTEDQKKDMSKEERETWEAKGKIGLLKGDMTLNSILSDMRGIFDSYNGLGTELKRIGINLSSDRTKPGQIEIDKEKLTNAIETDGENVVKLLVSKDKIPVKDHLGNTMIDSDGKEVMMPKGAFARVQNNIFNSCKKRDCTLLKLAGYEGTASVGTNDLSKQIEKRNKKIEDMEKDLITRENKFYSKWAVLEKMMNQLNSQQSSLMQQFGGMQ